MNTVNPDSNPPIDPYRDLLPTSQALDDTAAVPQSHAVSPYQKLPGSLTAVTILFIVMGILGLLAFLIGLIGIVFIFLADLNSFVDQSANNPLAKYQLEMNEMNRKMVWIQIISLIGNLAVSGLVLISGVGLILRKGWAAKVGITACKIGIGVEIVRLIQSGWAIFHQLRVFGTVDGLTGQAGWALYIGVIVGLVAVLLGLGYIVGKIFLYSWCKSYLKSGKATPYLTS